MRSLDFAAVIAFFVVVFLALKNQIEASMARTIFAVAAIVLLFLYATFELNTVLLLLRPGLARRRYHDPVGPLCPRLSPFRHPAFG